MNDLKKNKPRSRKWMLTFHDESWTRKRIKSILDEKVKPDYWAMSDEIGNKTKKKHTHLIFYRSSPIRAQTLEKYFPGVHQDPLRGSISEARSYILKTGKWSGTEKAETSIKGTFEESGEMPKEPGQGYRSDVEAMMGMVKENYTNLEIVHALPTYMDRLTSVERYRQLLLQEKGYEYRKMTVYYCYGVTGSGKTRGVYEMYDDDPSCICSVNSYQGNGIFDSYDSSRIKVLLLDEFRSSLPFGLLLALTDGHPQTINCRYTNRAAIHTTVWIVSNISLLEQYQNIQIAEPASWKALLRRINVIRHYYDIGKYKDYTVEGYLYAERYGFHESDSDDFIKTDEPTPFDNLERGGITNE